MQQKDYISNKCFLFIRESLEENKKFQKNMKHENMEQLLIIEYQ